MPTYPSANVVSRALKRDTGIIAGESRFHSYRVRGGYGEPAIWVMLDSPESTCIRKAHELADTLREIGWDVRVGEESAILYVSRVPTAREIAKTK